MIEKDKLYTYYIIENHSREETMQYFNVSLNILKKLLSQYGIKKDHKLAAQNNKNKYHMLGKKKYIENGHIKFSYNTDETIPVSYDDLYHDYIELNMPRIELALKYNVSESKIKAYLSFYNIKKSKSLSLKNRKSTFEEALKCVNKDNLISYYIDENHSREECCDHFNISMTSLKKIIKFYNLDHKDRHLVAETNRQVLMNKYGVNLPFDVNPHTHNNKDSRPNLKFKQLLEDNNIEFEREFPLGSYKYDFKVGNILIEINPIATHNVTYSPYGSIIDRNYHRDKTVFATIYNFRCIHVWDWDDLNKIIFLLKPMERAYARQCELKEVPKQDAKEFLDKYHIQSYCNDSIRLGLYHNNELVSIMTFGKPRYNNQCEYELLRFCSCKNIVGGKEKILKYFIEHFSSSIVSYCDLSKFSGKSYSDLGFKLIRSSMPTRHWYDGKQHITDNLLRQRGFDQLFGTSYGKDYLNDDLMREHGFVELYDCGQATYMLMKE